MIHEKILKCNAGVLTAALLFAVLMFFCSAEIPMEYSYDVPAIRRELPAEPYIS